VDVFQAPIAAEMPGVEAQSSKTSPSGSPQPRVSSIASGDGQFRRDLLIAAVAVTGIAAHLVLRFGFGTRGLAEFFPLYIVLVFGGAPLVFRLIQKSLAREFGSDLLAGISIIASALMGQFLVGSIVVLMLSGGTVLEEFATRRASSVLEALSKRMPQTAHRKTETGYH
jgi:cation transport ATPase